MKSAAIDFTCGHREGGVILMTGEELVRAMQIGAFLDTGSGDRVQLLSRQEDPEAQPQRSPGRSVEDSDRANRPG